MALPTFFLWQRSFEESSLKIISKGHCCVSIFGTRTKMALVHLVPLPGPFPENRERIAQWSHPSPKGRTAVSPGESRWFVTGKTGTMGLRNLQKERGQLWAHDSNPGRTEKLGRSQRSWQVTHPSKWEQMQPGQPNTRIRGQGLKRAWSPGSLLWTRRRYRQGRVLMWWLPVICYGHLFLAFVHFLLQLKNQTFPPEAQAPSYRKWPVFPGI